MLAGENSAALPRGSFNKVDKAEELRGEKGHANDDEEERPTGHRKNLLAARCLGDIEILFDYYCNSNISFCQEVR